jgi:hypothetical protein
VSSNLTAGADYLGVGKLVNPRALGARDCRFESCHPNHAARGFALVIRSHEYGNKVDGFDSRQAARMESCQRGLLFLFAKQVYVLNVPQVRILYSPPRT